MAGGASEPLPPAQPELAPPGSEAGRRPSAPPRRRRALRLAASLALLLSTAGVVFGWWVWNVFQVRTTNAYVVGNITPVSSDVGGQVVALYADDNMIVAAGAPLAQLDPVPFQLEVDRVLADLRNAQAEVRAAAVNVRLVRQDRRALLDGASARRGEAERAARAAEVEVQTRGQIHRKEQELLASQRAQVPGLAALEENARLYYERFSRLAASGDVPVQDRDNRAATYREATAKLESLRSDIAASERQVLASGLQLEEARVRLEQSRQALSSTDAAVVQAQAAQLQPDIATAQLEALEESGQSGRGGAPHRAAQPEPLPDPGTAGGDRQPADHPARRDAGGEAAVPEHRPPRLRQRLGRGQSPRGPDATRPGRQPRFDHARRNPRENVSRLGREHLGGHRVCVLALPARQRHGKLRPGRAAPAGADPVRGGGELPESNPPGDVGDGLHRRDVRRAPRRSRVVIPERRTAWGPRHRSR